MLRRKHLLSVLVTTLLTTLPIDSSFAFNINRPFVYRYSVPYIDRNLGLRGRTRLDAWPEWDYRRTLFRGQVLEIKRGGTDRLLSLLRNTFPNWSFEDKGNLEGSFDIQEYYACAPGYPVPIVGLCGGLANSRIGAQFKLNYTPRGADPRGDNVHWIQRVIASYIPGLDPFPVDMLDIDLGQQNPYYDDGFGDADPTYFQDTPLNQNPQLSHYFYAETYLVEEIAPQKVKIYNGVRWGWENKVTPLRLAKTFSDSLAAGWETDNFRLDGLTPGAKFYAWTNNDIPSNRCNPNTFLSAYDNSGYFIGYDNDSSPEGDGFASALMGTVPSNGIINLNVRAANPGFRGEDRGNYELYVEMYDEEESEIIAGGSGGGGVVFERPRPGGTQQNPILPNQIQGGWQIFSNVPSCRWYDPHTPYGFEFQTLEDTLFTEILDFPVGLDNRFTVSVGDNILGEFSPGDSVDFVSLLGTGVSNFKITGIDALIGSTEETAFPIQLAFNNKTGSFKMRPFSKEETPTPQSVPEPGSIVGLFALFGWSVSSIWKRKQR